jgi:hypothetical protein
VTIHNIEAAFSRRAAKTVLKAPGKRMHLYDIQAKAELVRDRDGELQIDRIILEAKNGVDFTVYRTELSSILEFRGLLKEMEIGNSEEDDDYYEELIGDLRRGETVRLDCVVAKELKRYGFDSL